MPTPILATKLYLPPARPKAVARPHLIQHMNEGLHRKLTLISAPAGFGKSTLASEWATACGRPVGWLVLDAKPSLLKKVFMSLFTSALTLAEHARRRPHSMERGLRTNIGTLPTRLQGEFSHFSF